MNWFQSISAQIDTRLNELEQERRDLIRMRELCTKMHGNAPPKVATIAEDVSKILRSSPTPLPVPVIYSKLLEQGRTFKGNSPQLSIYVTLKRKPDLFRKLNGGWALNKLQLDL